MTAEDIAELFESSTWRRPAPLPRLLLMIAIATTALLVGCRSKSNDSTQLSTPSATTTITTTTTTGDAMAVIDAAASSSAGAAADTATKSHGPPREACTLAAYSDGMAEGRRAFGEKRYDDATAAFRRAVAAAPLDPRARGELGFAALSAGNLDAADEQLRVGAELAAGLGDAKLGAQIWFNRGLVAEKQKRAEIARAAFAVSDRLHSTDASRKLLQGKIKCPIAIEYVRKAADAKASADGGEAGVVTETIPIVVGWKGVHSVVVTRIMGGAEGERERAAAPPATEEEAKARACVSYSLSEKSEVNPCSSATPPWTIQTGHLGFRSFSMDVIPLNAGRFTLIESVRGSGGPASGFITSNTQVAGDHILVMTTRGEAHFVVTESDCVKGDLDPALIDAGGIGYGDVRSLTTNSFTVFDTTMGKAILTGISWGEKSADTIKLTETELRLGPAAPDGGVGSNQTCATVVPLNPTTIPTTPVVVPTHPTPSRSVGPAAR